MTSNPVLRFNLWLAQARKAGEPLPETCVVATVDARNRPAVRYMLFKSADEQGWVFYTNTKSRKGRELAANPHVSMAFYWDTTGKQIRIDGRAARVADSEADAYWAVRPRASQLAAAVSEQSAVLESRTGLLRAYHDLEHRLHGAEIPRPAHWTGFRIRPRRIEFWTREEPRLHRRELFVRTKGGWEKRLLQP